MLNQDSLANEVGVSSTMIKFNMIKMLVTLIVMIFSVMPVFAESTSKAVHILQRMSLKEKIGQKLMLDFRYWCPTTISVTNKTSTNSICKEDFTQLNPVIKNIISQQHIGGIILFSNNLKNIAQIVTLTDALQKTMSETNNLPLLISTDQEGGIVVRLPRDLS
ncbi:MAG TPA: glycoside hydrolase family 3 N-terminal domain-containing protein, partial [Gammaproteobacteria bacterium]|nr:glycoside hydrolase family 3 N-terminal domain-containing protein [Gammaproteobacteria bacterium]